LVKIVPVSIALGAAFTLLTFLWACNPGRPWWRKRELSTDLCYWFFVPLFARYLRVGLLVLGAAKTIEVHGPDESVVVLYRGIERETYSCTPFCERRITLADGNTYFDEWSARSAALRAWRRGAIGRASTQPMIPGAKLRS
jgi:hypothetical protein